MNQSDIVEEKDNKQINIGPGDQLQAARIEQGLTIEDVATRMHLSLAILESIEENNFDDITAPIFVKGYLRAYARLVSLNEHYQSNGTRNFSPGCSR
jgi:cytoskeleton protein RodZ